MKLLLASLAVSIATDNGHNLVETNDLHRAIREFSNERINEIASELRHKCPGLNHFLRRLNGWPKEFPYARIKELIEFIALEVEFKEPGVENYSWVAGFGADPRGLVATLLEEGILLMKLSRTDEPRPYERGNVVELTNERWFAMHPMLAPGLGMVGA